MSLFRAYVNDRALAGFASHEDLRAALMTVIEARRAAPNLSRALYCSKQTSLLLGTSGETLIAATQSFPRPDRSAILQWLGRMGPFIEEEREPTDDDLFYFGNLDVTDEGLGQAGRQRQAGHDAHMISLPTGNGFPVDRDVLEVSQGLLEEPIATIEIPNHHIAEKLMAVANDAVPEPTSWPELLSYCRDRFGALLIGAHCDAILDGSTFYPNVARRTIELLKVLNEISMERDGGALSPRGEELKQNFFVGKKAWFTDEGDDNKKDFANEMNFPDPSAAGKTLQCFWHGKIKTPQFRIHFDWPNAPAGEPIRVCYIGPKISKR